MSGQLSDRVQTSLVEWDHTARNNNTEGLQPKVALVNTACSDVNTVQASRGGAVDGREGTPDRQDSRLVVHLCIACGLHQVVYLVHVSYMYHHSDSAASRAWSLVL